MAVVTLLASAFVAAGLSVAVATTVATILVNIAVSLAVSYLTRPEKTTSDAIRGELEAGAGTDASVVFGKARLRGQLVHYNRYGKGNAFNEYVYVLSDGWCDGLDPYVIIRDEKVDLVAIDTVNDEDARYNLDGWGDSIEIVFYAGNPNQQADPELVANANPSGTWASTHRGRNVCYAIIRMKWHKSRYSDGIPAIEFVLRGLRLYDWRRDSTFPGGSGAHRLADPSTWEFTENPAVCRYNYKLGIRGVSGSVIIGQGLDQSEIDHASYTFSANAADAVRTVEGEDHPTYACGLRAFSLDQHVNILDMLDNAMAGYRVERAGLDGVIAGAAQIPVLAITDAHIRADDEMLHQPRRSRSDRFNTLAATFTNPEALWQPDSLTRISDANDVLTDKRVILEGLSLPQINNPVCAQYVADIRYRQNRRMGSIPRLPVTLAAFFAVQAGDWVTHAGKAWLVTGGEIAPGFRAFLDLGETDAGVYSETGLAPVPPAPSVIPPGDGALAQTVTGLAVSATAIEAADHASTGRQWPALRITYDDPEDGAITAVIFEYRRQGGAEVFRAADRVIEGEFIASQGVEGGAPYEVRATIETDPPRVTAWTAWVVSPSVSPDRSVELVQAQASIRELLDSLSERMRRLEDVVPEGISASSAEIAGGYVRTRSLQKTAGSTLARVISEEQARADGDSALASSLLGVTAASENGEAQGLFMVSAEAAPTGWDARLALAVRAASGETHKIAGIFMDAKLDANGGQSRIVFSADQLIAGDTDEPPFLFEGGTLKLNIADIGTITAGTINLDGSDMLINVGGAALVEEVDGDIIINADLLRVTDAQIDGGSLAVVSFIAATATINPYDADYDYVRVSASGNVADSNGGPSSTGQPFLQLVTNAGNPELGVRQLGYGPTTTSNYDFHLLSGWVPMADISDASRYFRARQVLNDSPDSNLTVDWVVEKIKETV